MIVFVCEFFLYVVSLSWLGFGWEIDDVFIYVLKFYSGEMWFM